MTRVKGCLLIGWLLIASSSIAIPPQIGQLKQSLKPKISSISPLGVVAGSAGFFLTVNGTNFVSGDYLQWVGTSSATLATTYLSSSQLNVTIPSSLLTTAQSVQVSIYQSGKGGGTSNSVTFTISAATTTTTTTTISAPLAIATTSLSSGTVGTAYSATLAATGGTSPYSWKVSSGTLPSGITLAATTGALSGTPTTASTYSFAAQVTDSAGHIASYTYSLAIGASTTTTTTATHSIAVAWNTPVALSGVTITGYNIYRLDVTSSTPPSTCPTPSSSTTFSKVGSTTSLKLTDTTVAGGHTYCYYATALAGSVESAPSNISTPATVPSP